MPGTKLTQLTTTDTLAGEDLIYVVDQSAAAGSKSKGIRRDDFERGLNLTGGSNRLVSGGMVWVSGLIFQSINLVYEIGGTQYSVADGTQVTLDVADGSNPRLDWIYGDDSGALNKSTGTPASSPALNTLPSYQFGLKFVLVGTSATTPTGVSQRTVFTENAGQTGEFDATESTSAARIDLANTTTPLTGTKDIKTISTITDGDLITLVHATATTLANLDSIQFDIKCLADWSNDYLIVLLYDSTVLVGDAIINSSFLDVTDTTNTQTVNIFKSDFSLVSGQTEFDKIVISNRVRGASSILYQLDEIYINEDANGTQPTSVLASDIEVDTTAFSTNLSSADDTVQKALDTLDDLSLGAGDLLAANNLSDVASAATSRTNLGIDTTANQTDSSNKRFMTDAQESIVDDALVKSGDTMTGAIITADHGTATNPEVVSVVYGTGAAPTASTTPIGTLFIQYTA